MEFLGFANNDFHFFRKKNTMGKAEYDERKEEVKRHFREFCYQIQKSYHSESGGTLPLDKDFHGLGKSKNYITAFNKISDTDIFGLYIMLNQDGININLSCPWDGDPAKFEELKNVIDNKKEELTKFFKGNKSMHIVLFTRNSKKQGEDTWTEEFKFTNNELSRGDYEILVQNMEKLQPGATENKKLAGLRICTGISKSEAVKLGKMLPTRACAEVIKLLKLCSSIK